MEFTNTNIWISRYSMVYRPQQSATKIANLAATHHTDNVGCVALDNQQLKSQI
ncbi:MAG: hypothetical protein HC789_00005 [Microcoleus sp. CSU_2_2]|nr:hypothetical protein [Microcoleus sp. SU_5_3]NJS08854.1 hypothetical protein [Microcoleus sp. CSU_2_2]